MSTTSHSVRRLAFAVAAAAALFGGAAWISAPGAPGGCGHDPKLDDADAALEKAYVLIGAAQNPGIDPPFGGYDVQALRAINLARAKVAAAIDFAENSCH